MKTEQFTILLNNEPGVLNKILNKMTKSTINILGLTINETGSLGELRLIVDKIQEAKNLFKKLAITANTVKVLIIETDNKPGQLSTIAAILSKEDINIDYIYTISSTGQKAYTVVKTWNMEETEELFAEHGIDTVTIDALTA